MADVDWPEWLVPLYDSFHSVPQQNKIKFTPDVGPTIDRPTSDGYVWHENWQVVLVGDRYDDFLEWYNVTTQQGSHLANGQNYLTGEDAEVRITRLGQFRQLRKDVWSVNFTVEVL